MEYKVICQMGQRCFEIEVNKALTEGWQLQAGVSLVIDEDGDEHYAQALVKP